MSRSTVLNKPTEVSPSQRPTAPTGSDQSTPSLVTPSEPNARTGTLRETLRKVLLGCGIVSSVLYIALDVYAWSRYQGYSPFSQVYSELLAEGSPTRSLLLTLGAPYNPLVAALGFGVWASPGHKRMLRITGAMLVLYAIFSFLGGTLFQMDERGAEATARGSLHPIVTGVMLIFMLLSLVFGAFVHGTRFRLYSIGTILTIGVFASLTFLYSPQLAANEPTPGIGLLERVNIYAWMVWVALLSVSLWHGTHAEARASS